MIKKIFFFFALSFFVGFSTLWAATGIGVRPLRTNLNLNPGASNSFYLTIINNEDYTQIIKPEFQTYTSHNEQGYPVAKNMIKDDPENISSWVKFDKDKIIIKAKSEKKVKVTVSVPENAEPGGKYGALIYGPVLTDASGVSFRTRVASLLLLNVAGDERFDGSINGFKLRDNKMYSDKGIEFEIDFENKGNIHVSPKGTISIFDNDGNKVEKIYSVIDNSGNEIMLNDIPVNPFINYTLPGLKRIYPAYWKKNVGNDKYTAKLNFIFKKDDKEVSLNKEIKLNIQDILEVVNFNFVEKDGKTFFALKLKNNGTVYEKIKGKINVLNELDYKIGEINIPENVGYIKPGEEKEFEFKFLDKEMPQGDYVVKSDIFYGLIGKKLDLNKKFGFGNNLSIYLGLILLLIVLFIIWRKRKIKELESAVIEE